MPYLGEGYVDELQAVLKLAKTNGNMYRGVVMTMCSKYPDVMRGIDCWHADLCTYRIVPQSNVPQTLRPAVAK